MCFLLHFARCETRQNLQPGPAKKSFMFFGGAVRRFEYIFGPPVWEFVKESWRARRLALFFLMPCRPRRAQRRRKTRTFGSRWPGGGLSPSWQATARLCPRALSRCPVIGHRDTPRAPNLSRLRPPWPTSTQDCLSPAGVRALTGRAGSTKRWERGVAPLAPCFLQSTSGEA